MRTPIDDMISEQKLIALIGTERREIILQIGRPYVDADYVTRCPVAAWGLDNRDPDAAGGSLHALNLACGLLERRLLDCISAGAMKFFLPDSEEEGELSAKFFTMTMFGRIMVKQPRKPKSDSPTDQQEQP